jgi:hypothetical protein
MSDVPGVEGQAHPRGLHKCRCALARLSKQSSQKTAQSGLAATLLSLCLQPISLTGSLEENAGFGRAEHSRPKLFRLSNAGNLWWLRGFCLSSAHHLPPALARSRFNAAPRQRGAAFLFGGTMESRRIVAVGLLTKEDVALLGPAFDRLWPVDETPCFSQLLQRIDEADRDLQRERDQAPRD